MASSSAKFEMFRFREAKELFRQAALAVDPAASKQLSSAYKRAGADIQEGFRRAALYIRDAARSYAASTGAPRRLYRGSHPAIFAFSDFDSAKDDRRKRSVLVGVRTGLSYRARDPHLFVRWGFGNKRRNSNTTALGGVSMSFAALFEKGSADRRVRPRHYFQSAISSASSQVLHTITLAYHRAIEHINRQGN